jgi:hypothetical protein
MRLVQFTESDGRRAVAASEREGEAARRLKETDSVYELALAAIGTNRPLAEVVSARLTKDIVDLDAAEAAGRLLPPLDHPVPTRCWITGTGLTHLGGAEARNKMHQKIGAPEAELSDSMKMFKWGVEGGKPAGRGVGVQPEWFFKGNGSTMVASGQPLTIPSFSLDGGEEPEVAGLYVIAEDGTPCRVGFALGNELTDHVMEKQNYLYLAHSKLRACAVGPEVLLGTLPDDVRGTSRIVRGGKIVWEKPFLSGEANMSHWLSNLEHHHFKYEIFRRPGDVHVHFYGTSVLSFLDGFVPEPGDLFEVASPVFGRPLRNRLQRSATQAPTVRTL